MDLHFHTLDNGLRLVHHRTNGVVAHCGLIINAGSRNESINEHGIAHFTEHMLFKGTKKRRAYHILSRLEDVGGELNAYTTKEETAIHASFLKDDYERALEIFSDIVFNSTFPEREISKEKDVVLEEIGSLLDSPSESIFDDFEELVFAGQSIGRNILGTPESVRQFTQGKIVDFIKRNYITGEMVLCSVGNIPHEKITTLFKKYFSCQTRTGNSGENSGELIYKPASAVQIKDTFQNHCIIGNVAYNLRDKRRVGMFLLNNILGGQGLNSRLNLSLREKNGLAYNVESSYTPYTDTGIFSIYFGTDSKLLNKSISVCHGELKKLRTTRLGDIQLNKAKKQMKGYLARGYENHESLMLVLGKNLLVFNRIDSFEELTRQIENVTSSELLDIANEVLWEEKLSMLLYK